MQKPVTHLQLFGTQQIWHPEQGQALVQRLPSLLQGMTFHFVSLGQLSHLCPSQPLIHPPPTCLGGSVEKREVLDFVQVLLSDS